MIKESESIGNVNSYQHDAYLERRLKAWGQWRVKFITFGLGYPSKSIEGRMRADGGVLSKSTRAPQPPIDEEAEEMDELINALAINYPKCSAVLRMHYASLSKFEFEAKKINYELKNNHAVNISHGSYRSNLRLAKMWLAGRISK